MPTVTKAANSNTIVTTGWTNATNAYLSDNVYATAAPASNSTINSDFGFPAFATGDIPNGAALNSVTLTAEGYNGGNSVAMGAQLYNSTTPVGTESTFTSLVETTFSQVQLLDGITTPITLTDLRSAGTVKGRIRSTRSGTAATSFLDYVSLTVDYTAATSDLSALSISSGGLALSLSPTFASATTSYTASAVSSPTVDISATAVANNSTVQVRVNGGTLTGTSSGGILNATVTLSNIGVNSIDVVVTSGLAVTKTYTISITRAGRFDFQSDVTVDGVLVALTTHYMSTPSFSSNAYTLVSTDAGKMLLVAGGTSSSSVYIPANSTVAYPIGTQIHLIQTGTQTITILSAVGAGVTVLSAGGTTAAPILRVRYSAATLLKTGTNTWYVFGDII